jgi:hypothetical protein
MATAWKDLTKEERAARIKEGQKKAKARRSDTGVGAPDISALVAAEVAKALAGIKQVQIEQAGSEDLKALAKKDPALWTDEDRARLKKEHERLQAALEAIPYVGEEAKGLEPGTLIGDGYNRDYVPYTAEWFLNVEARRKDRNKHNGRPAELTWPDYQLHDVLWNGTQPWLPVHINGVTFNLLPGVWCKLPTPHYDRYRKFIDSGIKNAERFAQPDNPGRSAGYYHVSKHGLAVILGKGPLDSMEVREANDYKPEAV